MRTADAVVIGGGIGGLVAAHRLTQRGHAPVLLESRRSCGGLVFGAPIGGVRVDLGAESFARRSTATADLATELGLDIVLPGGQSWIWSHTPAPDSDDPGHAFRIPHGVLGIPTDLDDPEVRAALSPSGLERARMDLALPATVGADSANLADLVEARLGREVLDRLVVPIAGGVHSVHPSRLAVDVVTPGLRAALLEQGSLIAAAAHLRASAPPGPVVASVQGGLFRLTEALVSAIAADGGSIETGQVATDISRAEDGWVVTHADAGRAANPADPPVPAGEPQQVRTPRLIIALDGRAALDLLRTCPDLPVGDWTLPRGADLAQVCLVLNAPALDAAPRGSGLLVTPWMPGDTSARVSCKALTHYSVKWPDTVRGTGRHVVRVSYGRADEPAPEPTLEGALADASVILNCDLTPDQVSGHAIIRFPNSLPPQTPEHRERVAAFATVVADLPGLAVTGAWYAGTGLAAVVPHARASAEHLA